MGVRVNCVAPAVIETPPLDQLRAEAIEYMTTKIPMGRMGRPEEGPRGALSGLRRGELRDGPVLRRQRWKGDVLVAGNRSYP